MGFPSPAQDFVENRLNPHDMCTTESSRILETSEGYAVIDPVIKLTPGQVLLILTDGHTQFARLQGRALITSDGEAIEGEALEGVEVMGRVSFFIRRVDGNDSIPI
ncbi:TPA: hypothetical protein HIQ17_002798 [Escherichia coli]|uniref:hypothetical protein n=1 Tax=Escherichia coli TaxID=562 RepID=UPI000F5F0EB5|nr:hypothetical protein [Escherichia coli]MCG9400205.1 hypothetical protein [Escherichia coli]RRB96112.1 hypothetical protein EIA20_02120 [Escherichia coli]HAH9343226.1 hypothetical protein [Escherichia coli]HBB0331978.1 hypothetical protein [Escherichia coli]